MTTNWRSWLVLAFVALSTSCTTNLPRVRSPAASKPYSPGSVLTSTELRRLDPSESLLRALRELRPTFLTGRRIPPRVFIDGILVADERLLETIFVSAILDVQLVRGSLAHSAMAADGQVVVGDVVLVRTRR